MYLCETYSHYLYNQSDGLRLSEQFSLVICYIIKLFFVYKLITIATRHCIALQRFITLLFLFLHCIIMFSYLVVKC